MLCYWEAKPLFTQRPPLVPLTLVLQQGSHWIAIWDLKALALTEISYYTVAFGRGQGIDPIYNPIFWPCFLKEAQEDQTVKCNKSKLISNRPRVNGSIWAWAFSYFKHLFSFYQSTYLESLCLCHSTPVIFALHLDIDVNFYSIVSPVTSNGEMMSVSIHRVWCRQVSCHFLGALRNVFS